MSCRCCRRRRIAIDAAGSESRDMAHSRRPVDFALLRMLDAEGARSAS
jgi:hypothetical protein